MPNFLDVLLVRGLSIQAEIALASLTRSTMVTPRFLILGGTVTAEPASVVTAVTVVGTVVVWLCDVAAGRT